MRENIYWWFNTSLQVIATFVGLLAAGFFFIHGKIDDELKSDETLREISADIKRQYFRRFKALFILTGLSITLGLMMLYLNAYVQGPVANLFAITIGLLNIFTILWAGRFFIFMIDPEIINHTAQKLVKQNKDIFSSQGDQSISKTEFIDKFAGLDKILRKVALKSEIGTAGQPFVPFAEVIKELYEKGVINKEQLHELGQISKARNISAHSTVDFIESELGSTADKLNNELSIINNRETQS